MRNVGKCSVVMLALGAVSAVMAGENVFALPKMRVAPTIDGQVEAREWQDAAETQLFENIVSDLAFPGDAAVWMGRDAEHLYLAARMIVSPYGLFAGPPPPTRRNPGGDEHAFDGDGFEFDFISDKRASKESVLHLILASTGYYYSSGTGKGLPIAWDPGEFRMQSAVRDGYWHFEFAIPLKNVRMLPAESATHALRIARNWKYLGTQGSYGIQSTLSTRDNCFGQCSGACLTPFDDDAPVVQLQSVGAGGHGGDRADEVYPVKVRVANITAKPMDLKIRILGKPVNSQPVLVEMPFTLAPDAERNFEAKGAVLSDEAVDLSVSVTSADGTKIYHHRKFRFVPNFAKIPWLPHSTRGAGIDCKFAYYPSFHRVHVRADLSSDPAHGPQAPVKFTLLDAADKVLHEYATAADARGVADVIFAVPDLAAATRASGQANYRLVMNATGVEGGVKTNAFLREVFEWEGNQLGLSKTIPAPFEEVRSEEVGVGEVEVGVVLREHIVDKQTGLWQQVFAAGKPLLARPMRWVRLQSGSTTIDGNRLPSIAIDYTFDIDGCCRWQLTLPPGEYKPLALEIPLRGERAPLMHICPDGLRITYGGKVPEGQGVVWNSTMQPHVAIVGDYIPYIWVGGTLRGLAVFGENDKNWVTEESVETSFPSQQILREADGTVVIRLNLIRRPITLTEPRTISLGLQATPVKPMLKNWRQRPFGELYGSGYYWGSRPTDSDPASYDGTTKFWEELARVRDTGKIDRAFIDRCLAEYPYPKQNRERHVDRMRRHFPAGMDKAARARRTTPTCFYTNARGVDFSTPAGTTFCDEWNRQEWMWTRDFDLMSHRDYDLDPVASYRDYAAWWYRQMLLSRACDFLYWDDVFLQSNFNLIGTDAYRLADDTIQPASGVWNMRELVRRCAVLQAELGLDCTGNWVHMTSTAIAPISAFAGVHYDWEDGAGVNDFQDRYGMDYILACSIGRQMGCRVKMMGYFGKSTPEESKRLHRCALGVMLAHEFDWGRVEAWQQMDQKLRAWGYRSEAVKVWNYWDEDVAFPAAITGGKNAALAMASPQRRAALVIVSDFDHGGKYAVRPDAAALGLPTDFRAYDFETGAELPLVDGAAQVTLPQHDFAIVEFR